MNVVFRLDLKCSANLVEISGSFNGWKDNFKLVNVQDNVYTTVVPLPQGVYEYRYLVDGKWYDPIDKEYNERGNHIVVV